MLSFVGIGGLMKLRDEFTVEQLKEMVKKAEGK